MLSCIVRNGVAGGNTVFILNDTGIRPEASGFMASFLAPIAIGASTSSFCPMIGLMIHVWYTAALMP